MMRFNIPQKMKEWSIWALWWLLFGGAGLWLLVGSVAYWVKHDWLPNDTAVWVQALGSVLTILVAAWAAIYSASRQQAAQDEAINDRVAVLSTALEESARRALRWNSSLIEIFERDLMITNRGDFETLIGNLESEREQIQSIRISELPKPEMIKPFLKLITLLKGSAKVARLCLNPDSPIKSSFGYGLRGINRNIERHAEIFSAFNSSLVR